MASDPDQRTYDILRLLAAHEPVGSVHLTEHLRERGYSLTERTVRLILSDLDEEGYTEKAGGKGRRLTPAGRAELERGGVSGRVEHVRERLADLTSRVTYDPDADEGDLVVGRVEVSAADREALESVLAAVHESPLGPVVAAVEADGGGDLTVTVPSSVTVDGVLLSHGIDSHPDTLGLVEYHADPDPASLPYDDPEPATHGGAIRRFTDVIGDERATLDLVSLLIDAGRTDVERALAGETGLLVADNREVPLARFDAARALAAATRDRLGGVLDLRRPREEGPFPWGEPGWTFASLTYAGAAEVVIARCVEAGVAGDWETLAGLAPRSSLSTVA
ncbi:NrpR regulatory domain-containing protein [Halobacterium yunchengense]|uniref:NrpR regulatory domain-containing protein n=1 Tax=Halobacterium yunchengense TaxID=3108497 RepID=UPI00300B107E